MKNFKLMSLVFVSSMVASSLSAQGTYLDVNVGYAFPMSSQNLDFLSFQNSTSGNNSYTTEQINVSLGKGFNAGATFGNMFNANMGIELGVSYLFGAKTTATEIYPGGITESSVSSTMLRINPSLVFAAGSEKVNMYMKFGMLIGSGSMIYETIDKDGGDVKEDVIRFDGGMALGLSSAIGALFNINDKMTFFTELNVINLSYAPSKGEYIVSRKNGADELPDMKTREREIEFVDKFTYDDNNPPPDSRPSQELKQKLPYGSIGLNIGLKFKF